MARTLSTMIPLGSKLPHFALEEPKSGAIVSAKDVLAGKRGLLVAFICNHCPFVVHILDRFVTVANAAVQKGVGVIAINSNSILSHPQDGPEHMADLAKEKGFFFPFVFDRSQEVAKAFSAACTPDFFLFSATGELIYRGRFDAATPGNDVPVTGEELAAAIDAVAAGQLPNAEQIASIGCNIKWQSQAEIYG